MHEGNNRSGLPPRLAADILRLWPAFPDPQPAIEETPALRQRVERLLRWMLEHPGESTPCSCNERAHTVEDFMAKPPCLRHAAGRRRTGPTGKRVSVIFEVRERVDLETYFIEPFKRWLTGLARAEPPQITIEVTDGFERRVADPAAIDDIDLLAGRVRVNGVDWRIVGAGQPGAQPLAAMPAEPPVKHGGRVYTPVKEFYYELPPKVRLGSSPYHLRDLYFAKNPKAPGSEDHVRKLFSNLQKTER
jgi:hypothetical protein